MEAKCLHLQIYKIIFIVTFSYLLSYLNFEHCRKQIPRMCIVLSTDTKKNHFLGRFDEIQRKGKDLFDFFRTIQL